MDVPANLLQSSSGSDNTPHHSSGNNDNKSIPVTNSTLGGPETAKNHLLESGAKHLQSFEPPKRLCAHLHAFHVYASDTSRINGSHHYCAHLNDEVRQCLLYDSSEASARLIGVEYMITPRIYETLDAEERKLWHSHVFEVKSGLLVMPGPTGVPDMVWEAAETREMEQVVGLYGKVFQLWQTDRGDLVPLGRPELMMSLTSKSQFDFDRVISERDQQMGIKHEHKAKIREHIAVPEIHPDVDSVWKEGGKPGALADKPGLWKKDY